MTRFTFPATFDLTLMCVLISTTSNLKILSRFVEYNRNLQLFSLFRLLVDFVLRARANTQQLAG